MNSDWLYANEEFNFNFFPFGLASGQNIFQCMMDQILDKCDSKIGTANDIIAPAKDEKEHIIQKDWLIRYELMMIDGTAMKGK